MNADQQELRAIGAQIDVYLELLKATKGTRRRGRKPDPDRVQARIDAIDADLRNPNLKPTRRLILLTKQEKLVNSISEPDWSVESLGQLAEAEEAFVASAAAWAQAKGISRAAFKAMGVPKPVLDEAGL